MKGGGGVNINIREQIYHGIWIEYKASFIHDRCARKVNVKVVISKRTTKNNNGLPKTKNYTTNPRY